MADNPQDRRGSDRVQIEIPVNYTHKNTFFHDYIKNISLGGTFIRTTTFLPVGTYFRFIIRLSGKKDELNLKAEVVWVREKEEIVENRVLPQGMGIKFLFDSEEEQKRFNEEIEKLIRKELGDKIAEKLLGKKY